MADPARLGRELKLKVELAGEDGYFNERKNTADKTKPQGPGVRISKQRDENVLPTPPIDIPREGPETAIGEDPSELAESTIEKFLRERRPSVSFNEEVKLDSGHRQSMQERLEKPSGRPRGRSLLHALNEAHTRAARAHSESDRTHFDPVTGRHLPKWSNSPSREHARVGESRFPLLQSTVDAIARESRQVLPNDMSLTSDSTMSPMEVAVRTPKDSQEDFEISPGSTFPFQRAASYEGPKAIPRTASQRWRDGERSADFFARATARKGSTEHVRANRRPTTGSVASPHSAASSFLRAFSIGSRDDDNNNNEEGSSSDAEGETIGDNYVLGKQIGFGGFSVIKEVTQLLPDGTKRKLAAKIVRRHIEGKSEYDNEQAQAEFEHEVELWRRLNHPRLLSLEEVYVTDEATYCLIPLTTGGTLFDLIRKHRQGLPLPIAQRYTYQLASALRYLHRDARVVHRDVKLENVLLDHAPLSDLAGGNIRLCDFGMAEWLVHDYGAGLNSGSDTSRPPSPEADRPPMKHMGPSDTSTSAFTGGSLDYAAPEIVRRAKSQEADSVENPVASSERSIISPAVDVWALGVCVYAIVVGSRPFSNAFQPRVVMSILAGDWDRDALKNKGGGEVLELVEGCLAMSEYDRWTITDVLACRWLKDVRAEMEEEEQDEVEENGISMGSIRGGSGSTPWRL